MMKFYLLIFLFSILFASINAQAKRVPTTEQIEDYDDPVLREIFKKKIPPNPELQANNGYQQQQYYNPNGYQGGQVQPYSQIPQGYQQQQQPQFQQRYQSQPSFSSNQNQGNRYIQQYANSESGQAFTNLAATGAQNFYTGAQTVSNAFGLPQYEAPFISSAASLFGR